MDVMGDFMARKKVNFRGPLEVEKFLFDVSKKVVDGRISATAAGAATSAANAWLRAHSERKLGEMEQRIAYLEAQKTLDEAKARKKSKKEV